MKDLAPFSSPAAAKIPSIRLSPIFGIYKPRNAKLFSTIFNYFHKHKYK